MRDLLSMENWFRNRIVSQQELKNVVNYWRKVLRRIVDATIMLVINNLPFRAHRITDNTKPQDVGTLQGSFLQIIKLFSYYDVILADLLMKPKGSTNYLSPDIQNELINLTADEINVQIKSE